MTVYITRVEDPLNFLIFIGALLIAFYEFYATNDKILKFAKFEFEKGWNDLPFDVNTNEFKYFKVFVKTNFIWYLLHLLATEIIKCFNSKFIPLVHFLIGFLFISQTFQIRDQVLILIELISFFSIRNIPSKKISWLLGISWIVFINYFYQLNMYNYNFEILNERYQIVVLMSWNILRGLSYIFDKQAENEKNPETNRWDTNDVMKYCGYMFYFPTFIYGPFIIYERYAGLFKSDFREKDVFERVKKLLFEILKVGFWIFFFNISLHFLYVHYLENDPEAVKLLNRLGLYGFGYLMGLYFNLTYIISYGFGIAFLRYDSISPPRAPICIARVHFYSKMWRRFDEGLYEFLFKYIYSNLQIKSSSALRKLLASGVTFLFIYAWHGLTTSVFLWATLNYLCVVAEKVFKSFWKSKYCNENIKTRLSISNQNRLFGLIGCHILLPSFMANFYFFAGTETGNYIMLTTYTSGFLHYLKISSISYCIFQTSEWIEQIFRSRKKNLDNNLITAD